MHLTLGVSSTAVDQYMDVPLEVDGSRRFLIFTYSRNSKVKSAVVRLKCDRCMLSQGFGEILYITYILTEPVYLVTDTTLMFVRILV
jgi:hypothetical protein